MWSFVDTVAKQICVICQIYQIVRFPLVEEVQTLCELATDKGILILSTLTTSEPVVAVLRARTLQPRRQKHWLRERNRGSLVSGALSQEVRS